MRKAILFETKNYIIRGPVNFKVLRAPVYFNTLVLVFAVVGVLIQRYFHSFLYKITISG
jgi:hypothetical protein